MSDAPVTPIQRPLTAMVPVKADSVAELRTLTTTPGLLGDGGLNEVGTVHFARIFVVAEDNHANLPPNTAAVITTYDGDFAAYIQAFVSVDSVAMGAKIRPNLHRRLGRPEVGILVQRLSHQERQGDPGPLMRPPLTSNCPSQRLPT